MMDNRQKEIGEWYIYPDRSNGRFLGYITKDDITQCRGAFPVGQNIRFLENGNPTLREGCVLVGTSESTATTPITRAWRFERRDGVEIEMRSYSTVVEYRIDGVMDDFKLLKGSFTTGLEFCFAVISKSTNTVSLCYFCNGAQDWQKWSGVYATLVSFDDAANTLTIDANPATLGFTSSGTLIVEGLEITYSGLAANGFTGCSSMAALTAVAGDIVAQSPVAASLTSFLGSVGMVHDGRIHARLETKQSVANYSKLDDPDTWTTGSLDGDGGAKEIEQGGAITAFAHDEEKLYIIKKRLIKTLQFKEAGDRVDVPVYKTYKPSDDKSSTVGAVGQRSTFHSPNGVIFVTEDKTMLHLTREQNLDYPQLIDISSDIEPTFRAGEHGSGAGIVYKGKAYYAFKESSTSSYNDVVAVYDIVGRRWDAPYVGWNVADWTIINNKLHWHSSSSPNTYELQDDAIDNGNAFTSILRTHAEDFGLSQYQKTISHVMLEIYMLENSTITLNVLYDEDGYSENTEVTLNGETDEDNKINSESYNAFGASAFGYERFGSNADLSGMKKYRYIIPLKGNVQFFHVSLQLSTNDENSNYELVRYGYFLSTVLKVHPKKFIKNIS